MKKTSQILFLITLSFSNIIAFANDGIEQKDKCINKICDNESCYEKDLTFVDIDRSKFRKANWESGHYNAKYYELLSSEKDLIDVTERVLKDSRVSKRSKKAIRTHNRKIFVFLYPSDGIMVPGFISFVLESGKSDLIFPLRGGNRMLGVYHPVNYVRWGKNSILGTLYRGNVGEGKDEYGGADVNDIKNLVNYIPTLEKRLDQSFTSNKKYLLGNSRGGIMMFLAITRYPELQDFFDKAISNSGLVDLEIFSSERPKMHKSFKNKFGMTEENKEAWFKQRSARYHIDKIDKNFPILILQGTSDIRLGLRSGVELYNLMKNSGHNVTYWEIKDGAHCLMNCADRLEVFDKWLNQ